MKRDRSGQRRDHTGLDGRSRSQCITPAQQWSRHGSRQIVERSQFVEVRPLLFLRRDKSASVPAYAKISAAEAGARLYANTLNALAHPGSGLDVAIRIAAAVPAFTVDAGELQATCELIAKLEENI